MVTLSKKYTSVKYEHHGWLNEFSHFLMYRKKLIEAHVHEKIKVFEEANNMYSISKYWKNLKKEFLLFKNITLKTSNGTLFTNWKTASHYN